jgi:hypothetical protein
MVRGAGSDVSQGLLEEAHGMLRHSPGSARFTQFLYALGGDTHNAFEGDDNAANAAAAGVEGVGASALFRAMDERGVGALGLLPTERGVAVALNAEAQQSVMGKDEIDTAAGVAGVIPILAIMR